MNMVIFMALNISKQWAESSSNKKIVDKLQDFIEYNRRGYAKFQEESSIKNQSIAKLNKHFTTKKCHFPNT